MAFVCQYCQYAATSILWPDDGWLKSARRQATTPTQRYKSTFVSLSYNLLKPLGFSQYKYLPATQ